MDRNQLYQDIAKRTQGDIYIGVVGPVRTGKSTFISRFMDHLILPGIENDYARARVVDEMPQSGTGKTIMTTQPKFVPNEAVQVDFGENAHCNVRMVDCVGYWVPGAIGNMEADVPRMVRTPWFDHEIPFEEAAEIGTRKVITDHSTIGILMTTDGSITDIPRENYVDAEERVVSELRQTGKPFVIVINSTDPNGARAQQLKADLMQKYDAGVTTLDALHMTSAEATDLLSQVLMEFPLSVLEIRMPGFLMELPPEHPIMQRVLAPVRDSMPRLSRMRDHEAMCGALQNLEDFQPCAVESMDMGTGRAILNLQPQEGMFFNILSEASGCDIADDYELMETLKSMSAAKRAYDRIAGAMESAQRLGYGMVPPSVDEMELAEPEIIQQGNRFAVRLKANSTGFQIFRVDMNTEVSPVVGSAEQSEALMDYLMSTFEKDPAAIWQTNIFGKSLYDLVRDSMAGKSGRMPDTVQQKLQKTIQRIANDGCNGLICILL